MYLVCSAYAIAFSVACECPQALKAGKRGRINYGTLNFPPKWRTSCDRLSTTMSQRTMSLQ